MTSIFFPPADTANEDGLVFVGGDVTKENILRAYQSGIFPWPISINLPMTWFSPDPRGVIYTRDFTINKSLRKFHQKRTFSVTMNKNFREVIKACAKHHEFYKTNQYGTWITPEMIDGYTELFESGNAFSIEVWSGSKLVGGLYGVLINKYVSAESMFFTESNASKVALIFINEYLVNQKIPLLDVQMVTPTTEKFGAINIPRRRFLEEMKQLIQD